MNYNKNFMTYIVWGFYSITLCFLAFFVGNDVFTAYFAEKNVLYNYLFNGIFILVLIGIGFLIFFLLRKLARHKWPTAPAWILRLLPVLVLAGGVTKRVLFLLTQYSGMYGSTQYYDSAIDAINGSNIQFQNALDYRYTRFLYQIFSFLGDKENLVPIIQSIIGFGAVLLFYVAIKTMAGKVTGLVFLAFTLFCPYFQTMSITYDSNNIYYFQIGVLFGLLAGYYLISVNIGWRRNNFCEIYLFVMGLLSAAILTSDLSGILFVAGIFIVIFKSGKQSITRVMQSRITVDGLLFGIFFVLMKYTGLTGNYLHIQFLQWMSDIKPNFDVRVLMPQENIIWSLILIFLGIITCFSTWISEKDRNRFYMAGVFFLALFFPVSGMSTVNSSLLLTTMLATVIGNGLHIITLENSMQCIPNAETIETTEAAETAENIVAEKEEEPAPKTRFIKNPLPVPKKHVKKALDYKYTVEEDKMHFDIENDEKDDFDF